jgi:Cu/Ag efflux protein CusF
MKILRSLAAALVAVALLSASAQAADAVAGGKVKSVNAKDKQFVLTDSQGKDWTFTLGDEVTINRGGKEGVNDLAQGDAVNVCYDKGLTSMTAHYVLIQEGTTKNQELVHAVLKSYDADKKEVVLTDENKKDWTYAVGNAKVRRNNKTEASIADIKIGDKLAAIVETVNGTPTLKLVMFKRT